MKGLRNIIYATRIAGAMLFAGNSYSQGISEENVKVEEVKKEFRKLDNEAKNLTSTLIYTNPTSIKFDSLDQKTKNRLWSILSNHYELEVEQFENKLKDYEATQDKNADLQKTNEKLVSESKKFMSEIESLKEKYEPADEKKSKK